MNIKGSKKARKDFFTGMGFILPSLLGFLIFTFIPVVISLCLSFTSWNFMEGIEGIKFNGLANYIRLFSDEWFLNSYKNNIIFTAVTVPVLIALGLVMATIINKYIYGGGVVADHDLHSLYRQCCCCMYGVDGSFTAQLRTGQ